MIGKTNALAGGKLKSASGTGKLSALQGNIYPLIVTGLDFVPCAVFYGTYSLFPTEGIAPVDFGFVVYDQNRENCIAIRMPLGTDGDDHRRAKTYATSNIMQGGFNVPQYKSSTVSTSRTYYWLALGV